MGAIHGRDGRLYVAETSGGTASPVATLNSWSLNATTDRVEVTAFGDTNRVYVAGLPDVQGDFAGYYDTTGGNDFLFTAATDGNARKFYLYADTDDTSTYWYGQAVFDFSASGSVDGAVEISGSYAATSDVNYVSA